MKYTFDFSMRVWVSGLEIEADSYEEAKEDLKNMKFDKLTYYGYVEDHEIDEIDGDEYTEEDYKMDEAERKIKIEKEEE